ncbi:metallophosphoesterase [Mucilaginibacter sp.]|uniref:metallophosphoesterase n=1 Tax=Mucilaginibacter sp. TaxID=1882438 RepID=UPI003D0B77C4
MSLNKIRQVSKPLLFAHIGDLHITKAKEQNYIDLLSIIAQIEVECSNNLDFVVLPGDNADNGLPEQYLLVATALKMLSIPVHIIPGDHDMEQGGLQGFYALPGADQLPKAININGINCLFLDVSGPGNGGPDFKLGNEQMTWLQNELATAKAENQETVVFVHTYPDDIKDEAEKIVFNRLIAENEVALIDMGHTHYNELSNDGDTIFSATRSTGQIEEGPVGYSLISIDQGVVSWRFKALHDSFPFVLITSPAAYQLVRKIEQVVSGSVEIRAIVFGSREIQSVQYRLENGSWSPMSKSNDNNTWSASALISGEHELINLTVQAIDQTGRPGQHTLQLATPLYKPAKHLKNGSDADSIGAWPGNGIFGTQLGPNRNAKPLSKP